MENCIQGLNARHFHADRLGDFDGRTQVCLNLHRAFGNKVLVHDAVGLRRGRPCCDSGVLEIWRKCAVLSTGDLHELIHDLGDGSPGSLLFDQLHVRRRFKQHTQRMKGDVTGEKSASEQNKQRGRPTLSGVHIAVA